MSFHEYLKRQTAGYRVTKFPWSNFCKFSGFQLVQIQFSRKSNPSKISSFTLVELE
jgi:hypothetical protein